MTQYGKKTLFIICVLALAWVSACDKTDDSQTGEQAEATAPDEQAGDEQAQDDEQTADEHAANEKTADEKVADKQVGQSPT